MVVSGGLAAATTTSAYAASGALAYVVNGSSRSVSVIDTDTGTVTGTVGVGSDPFDIASAPSINRVYVANQSDDTVSVIDTATNTVAVGDDPIGVAATPDGTRVYTANQNDNTASVIDTATNTVTGTVTVGSSPLAVAFGPPPASQEADIAVGLSATGGVLSGAISYTMTATNNGPADVTAATLTATLPAGVTATNLATGCTQTGTALACTYGPVSDGATADKTFRLPIALLDIGQVTVTAQRTSSTPADPDPANDTAGKTCTVISKLLATC